MDMQYTTVGKNLHPFLLKWFERLERYNVTNILPDKMYLRIYYYLKMGERLNLKNPQSFNEKLQWLKLYDRNAEYSNMVDKYEAKKYVADRIGNDYIIPTLGVWDCFDDIDFDSLPNQFVLKCTHDSGGIVFCKNKSLFDKEIARKAINNSLKKNYYWHGREWCYKNVKPRIIAEKYISEENNRFEYKFFCFNGKSKCVLVCEGDGHSNKRTNDFYDMNFVHMPFVNGYPCSDNIIKSSEHFDDMRRLAEILAAGHPFLRVDFYLISDKIFFGELTFYHWSGMSRFEPKEWDKKLGEYISLTLEE